ncbi:MAG TPA: TetR family transcriptional regulator [Pseudonocardia sp.]|jgi:AcrR family transcriptional regulator|uniref:TetR/AcrR family transcriptional regulator n=1 Tax=Pseudonocardia sp. TaxID=60912 RepID=UPI002F414299
MNKPRGRPRGNPPTRARIAEVARARFLRDGYRGTTLRAVAGEAGVDPALVSYHFGSKQGLFSESMKLRRHPSDALAGALRGDPASLPERLLRAVVQLWDDPETGGPLTALVRMSVRDEAVMRVYREYLEREVAGRIVEYLGGPDASERAAAAVALIGGLILTRYLTPLSPMANLTGQQVQQLLAAALRAALYGAPARHHRTTPG